MIVKLKETMLLFTVYIICVEKRIFFAVVIYYLKLQIETNQKNKNGYFYNRPLMNFDD